MYKRKTRDEYEIQGYYGSAYGWETVFTADTMKEAKSILQDYETNEPYPHRIKKSRIPIDE